MKCSSETIFAILLEYENPASNSRYINFSLMNALVYSIHIDVCIKIILTTHVFDRTTNSILENGFAPRHF